MWIKIEDMLAAAQRALIAARSRGDDDKADRFERLRDALRVRLAQGETHECPF
jgi:hypothetical protein